MEAAKEEEMKEVEGEVEVDVAEEDVVEVRKSVEEDSVEEENADKENADKEAGEMECEEVIQVTETVGVGQKESERPREAVEETEEKKGASRANTEEMPEG